MDNTKYNIVGYDTEVIRSLVSASTNIKQFEEIRNSYLVELSALRDRYQSQLVSCLTNIQNDLDLKY